MKIAIHVGYPKCASTTLQKHLFDKHPEINYLGIYPGKNGNIGIDTAEINKDALYLTSPHLRKLYNNVIDFTETEYFCLNKNENQHVMRLLSQDKLNLFSHESFLSVFFSNPSLNEKAKRIYNIFPNSKVFLIIRRQTDVIKSQYADWPYDPRALTMKRTVGIDDWIATDIVGPESRHFIQSLKYYNVFNLYCSIFGPNNVGIFLFEDLVNDIEIFGENLSSFLNIDKGLAIRCLYNKHENRARDRILRTQEISNRLESQLRSYFGVGNALLEKERCIGLSKYNYPIC